MTYFPDTVPRCAACSITLERRAVIGRLADPDLFLRSPEVIRTSRGQYIAAVPNVERQGISVFDRGGRFVRTIGGYGGGPGEFRRVSTIALGANDSLYVVHDYFRMSVFDSTGHYVRGVPHLGARVDGIMPVQGALVVNANVRSDELVGIPLHVVDLDGRHLRAFGDLNVMAPYGGTDRVFNAGDGDGRTVWVAENNQYRFDRIDTYGRKLRVIGVAAPMSWYSITYMTREDYLTHNARAKAVVVSSSPEKVARPAWPPPFRVSGVHAPGNGLLFVSLNVPADEWEQVELEYEDLPGEVRLTDGARGKLYRTIIDVIDIESGEVRARTQVDGQAYLTNDGTLVRIAVTDAGLIQVETYAVQFTS